MRCCEQADSDREHGDDADDDEGDGEVDPEHAGRIDEEIPRREERENDRRREPDDPHSLEQPLEANDGQDELHRVEDGLEYEQREERADHLVQAFEVACVTERRDRVGHAGRVAKRALREDQERLAVGVADVVDAADVLVGDLTGEAHLVVNCASRAGSVSSDSGRNFNRDRLIQRQVVGAVDFAHPALAQPADNAIAAGEDGTRLEAAP
jgi:hypothetical protein